MRTSLARRPVQALVAAAILLSCITLAGGGPAHADTSISPVPPPGYVWGLTSVHADGQQIYRCQPTGSGGWDWAFVEPSATLTLWSDEFVFGHHMAGPTWRHLDGSTVVGEKVASIPSPTGSIPWLLLRATSWTYGPSGGSVLARTDYIQRTDTTGGLAPSIRCDSISSGRLYGSNYTATYTFYKARAQF
jgi:hypothetical protein